MTAKRQEHGGTDSLRGISLPEGFDETGTFAQKALRPGCPRYFHGSRLDASPEILYFNDSNWSFLMLRSVVLPRTVHTSALVGLFVLACGGDDSPCVDGATCASTTQPTIGVTSAPSTTASVTPTPVTSSAGVNPPPVAPGPTATGGATGTTGPTGSTTGSTAASGPTASTTSAPSSTSSSTTGPVGTTSEVETSAPVDTTGGPEPTGDPNPSGFPEPGAGGTARPSGTAGGLKVLPWAGFAGALSYTFDDATGSQQGNAEQMLSLGVEFTWYLNVNNTGGNALHPMYQQALDQGHELGNHTRDHSESGSDAEAMQSWLMDNYQLVAYTMAAPNGKTAGFDSITNQKFLLDRGVNGGTIGPDGNTTWTNLPTALPNQGAGESVFKGYADGAAGGKWQTVCIHGFTTGGSGGYQPVDFNGWKAGVEYAKTKNLWITSMVNVASYLIGGKAVSSATPAAEGGGQKWTWTLKDTFPPGHYVRVTVDGGTLSQDGQALPWNEHGYYEVSLDAGELTLTP